MDTQTEFGPKQLLTYIISEAAKAVSLRGGETREQQMARARAAVHVIVALGPRDAAEAMLAGRCLMYHELTVDGVRETLSGEIGATRCATRANLIAMDKVFGENLARLEQYQTRIPQGDGEALWPLAAEAADRAIQTPPPPPARASRPVAAPFRKPASAESVVGPSPESMAACQSNPAAMAALEAGDPLQFARALGIEPNPEFLAAAACPGGPFDPKAWGKASEAPRANGQAANGRDPTAGK